MVEVKCSKCYQGILNILDFYFEESDLFYREADNFFKPEKEVLNRLNSLIKTNFNEFLENVSKFYMERFQKLGFKKIEIESKFSLFILEIESKVANNTSKYTDAIDFYNKVITPLIHELIFEKIVDYFVDLDDAESVMINLRTEGTFPTTFMIEINNLKDLFEKDITKLENLKKYNQIRDVVVNKFLKNKHEIEYLEDLQQTNEKLQLLYFIYRILNFFFIETLFDFTHLEIFLKDDIQKWLKSLPLISLRNPELYFCGIYLATSLNITIDKEKIKDFLLKLHEEIIDEFENPIIEDTCKVYYFVKSIEMLNLDFSEFKVEEFIKLDFNRYDQNTLQNLQTSHLVIILKIFKMLGIYNDVDIRIINNLKNEINNRVTDDGIIQSRDGLISSESTYYAIFFFYVNNLLEKLKEFNFLADIVFRIYRNLELLYFSGEINYDLFSEIFYSCENLKLINSLGNKEMSLKIAKFLFPNKVVEKISNSKDFSFDKSKFRLYYIDKVQGTIYR